MKRLNFNLVCCILLILFPILIASASIWNEAKPYTNGTSIIETEHDSSTPQAFKIKDGYLLFWEEIYTHRNSDIFYTILNENGKPINNKVNITDNDYQSFIIDIISIHNKYIILSRNQKISKDLSTSYITYDLISLDLETGYININTVLTEEDRIPDFVNPSICFDSENLILLYTKKIYDLYFSSTLYIRKYNSELTQTMKEKALIINDKLKMQTRIIFSNNQYQIFYRERQHKSNRIYLYKLKLSKELKAESPELISIPGVNVYDYRIFYHKDNNKYFIIWNNHKYYYYKYITENEIITKRIPLNNKTYFLSNIEEFQESYLYIRIIEKQGSKVINLERINMKEPELAKYINISQFPKNPDSACILNIKKNNNLHKINNDSDKNTNTVLIIWSEKIKETLQLHFKLLSL
ncbi:MAG: hypothetical protein ACOCV8_03755 [Spirochaetota bacterium]